MQSLCRALEKWGERKLATASLKGSAFWSSLSSSNWSYSMKYWIRNYLYRQKHTMNISQYTFNMVELWFNEMAHLQQENRGVWHTNMATHQYCVNHSETRDNFDCLNITQTGEKMSNERHPSEWSCGRSLIRTPGLVLCFLLETALASLLLQLVCLHFKLSVLQVLQSPLTVWQRAGWNLYHTKIFLR